MPGICQCNDGIVTIVVHMSEEPFLTFWTDMETTLEEEDEVVADGIRKVRALEVLVRGSQGRGSAGSQKQTVRSQKMAMTTYGIRRAIRGATKNERHRRLARLC